MDMKDCTISSESYEKFARSDRSQRSNERVQELIDGGLMSQGRSGLCMVTHINLHVLMCFRCHIPEIYGIAFV